MREIRAIIFDLGKVLLDFSFEHFYQWIQKNYNKDKKQVLNFLKSQNLIQKYESGRISTDQFFSLLRSFLHSSSDVKTLQQYWDQIFFPIDVNIELLKHLYWNRNQYNIRLGLLSNTNESHKQYIEKHYPIFSYFDITIFSYEVGLLKPQKEIYEMILKQWKIKPEYALFIDDRKENVEGARQAGMYAIQYQQNVNLESLLKYQFYIHNFSYQNILFIHD